MGRFPFPQNQRLPGCIYPAQAHHKDPRIAYLRFKEEIVTAEGARGFLRPRRPDTPDGVPNSTVSEGVAYGMIIAVMFDDQPLFDAFWQYALCFLNPNGLMSWYIAPDGQSVLGSGGATDSDEDMAWALVMAHRQWGGRGSLSETYLSHAQRQIERLWQLEVDHGERAFMLLPGDEWQGRDVFNPSYFAPHQYRLFGEIVGKRDEFQSVIDRGYSIVEGCLNAPSGNAENGLVPAWCDASGAPVEAFPGAMTNYQTDSARLPFRLGQDWAYHQEPRAQGYLAKVSAFFAGIGADHIGDGYTLRGESAPDPRTAQPNPGSAVFVGCAAVGAQHDARHQAFIDAAYQRVRTGKLLARSRYYNHCWTVLSLLMLTGNLVNYPDG